MADEQIPFPIEDFLAAAVEALKIRGDSRAITVLLEGKCQFAHDNTDWGVDYWTLLVALPVHIFYAMTEEDRKSTAESILSVGKPFFSDLREHGLANALITPKVVPATETWRTEAIAYIKG